MLSDRELQRLRNMGNECEEAADEIERLRGERKVLLDLLGDSLANIKTIDAESTDERALLADLISQIEAALLSGPTENNGPGAMELFSKPQSTGTAP